MRKTKQPSYFCIANQGDVNPLENGGQFVIVDRRAIYVPQMWVWEPDRMLVSEVALDRCFPIKDRENEIGANRFHPDKAEWFGDCSSIASVASTVGKLPHFLCSQLCDADPRVRAEAYYDLFLYYGSENFDSQPLEMTRAEAKRMCALFDRQIKQSAKWRDGIDIR